MGYVTSWTSDRRLNSEVWLSSPWAFLPIWWNLSVEMAEAQSTQLASAWVPEWWHSSAYPTPTDLFWTWNLNYRTKMSSSLWVIRFKLLPHIIGIRLYVAKIISICLLTQQSYFKESSPVMLAKKRNNVCTRLLTAEEMTSEYFWTSTHQEHLLHLLLSLFRDCSVLYLKNENTIYWIRVMFLLTFVFMLACLLILAYMHASSWFWGRSEQFPKVHTWMLR